MIEIVEKIKKIEKAGRKKNQGSELSLRELKKEQKYLHLLREIFQKFLPHFLLFFLTKSLGGWSQEGTISPINFTICEEVIENLVSHKDWGHHFLKSE